MPKAIRLLETADPETLPIARQAFDEAWQALAGNYGNPSAAESARLRLATYILHLADDGERNIAKLRDGAMAAMARDAQPLKFDPTKRSPAVRRTR